MNNYAISIVVLITFSLTAAAQDIQTERVQFQRGASEATINAKIKGYQSVNYLLDTQQGQSMEVVLNTDNASNYFNIFAPGKKPGEDEAMFIGSTEGNRYAGTLPVNGDYSVQVFLMRNAARRDETANYTLKIEIAPRAH